MYQFSVYTQVYIRRVIKMSSDKIIDDNDQNKTIKHTVFPHIVSAHVCTVTFGLMYSDLWISKLKK